jgi:hypothetical protein
MCPIGIYTKVTRQWRNRIFQGLIRSQATCVSGFFVSTTRSVFDDVHLCCDSGQSLFYAFSLERKPSDEERHKFCLEKSAWTKLQVIMWLKNWWNWSHFSIACHGRDCGMPLAPTKDQAEKSWKLTKSLLYLVMDAHVTYHCNNSIS